MLGLLTNHLICLGFLVAIVASLWILDDLMTEGCWRSGGSKPVVDVPLVQLTCYTSGSIYTHEVLLHPTGLAI